MSETEEKPKRGRKPSEQSKIAPNRLAQSIKEVANELNNIPTEIDADKSEMFALYIYDTVRDGNRMRVNGYVRYYSHFEASQIISHRGKTLLDRVASLHNVTILHDPTK